jgi:uncharacterized membrane protein YphA (DoxX/SURF4 family)
MSIRQRVALSLPALLLRIVLGATFLWAGLGKLLGTFEVSQDDAAILANMGVLAPDATRKNGPAPAPAAPETPPDEGQGGGGGADAGGATPLGGVAITLAAYQPDGEQEAAPAAPAGAPAAGASGSGRYTAADFPEPRTLGRMYAIALMIHRAANPAPKADGGAAMPLWPAPLATGRWPVYLAYAVMIAELAGGASVLLGLLTRLWSLSLVGVMLGAIWLASIGPAVQSGNTLLGFLPNHPAFDEAWMPIFWQFSLLFSGAALFFAGSGTLAVDNLVFGRPAPDDHDGE